MASVFLSYDREDVDRARPLAAALEKAGHKVWWDRHIKGGSRYAAEIERALGAADAVVVLWSHQSVQSDWVRDEAAKGRDSGRLVPARIDDVEPPLGFGQHQTTDLSRFKGRASSPQFRDLLDGIEGVATGATEPRAGPKRRSRWTWQAFHPAIAIAVLAAIILAGAYFAWNRFSRPGVPIVAVAPANSSPAASALAQDLLAKLGALQSSDIKAIRLADVADVKRADLLFRVNGSLQGQPTASVSLVAGKDGSILWSGTFEQPSGNAADLKQQIAFTAARLLGCASDGLSLDGKRLDQQALKAYLNICAQTTEMMRSDPTPIVHALAQIVADKPDFQPAWEKLLMAESEINTLAFNDGEPPAQVLAAHRRHIAEAKRRFPGMAEADLAEAALLPPEAIKRRTALIDQAAARSPDNPNVQSFLAGAMASVGRNRDAMNAASRAVELDPLSPAMINGFISTLAYAGATPEAERELRKAEKLWPGTASIEDAQFRFHLRYGDPKIAQEIFLRETDTGSRAWKLFLEARINPSPANVGRLMTYVRERLRNMSNPSAGLGFATLAYGSFGLKEEIIETLLEWPKPHDIANISEVLFRPEFREVRRDPRFMQIANRAGLVDYWRQSGKWPDFCFEAEKTYDCKVEAAKIAS